jgi:hypothetical protein
VTDLRERLGPSRSSRALGHQQHPDRFDVAIRGLGDPLRPARQGGPGGFDSVELIGLAVAATLLAVRSVDLDHRHRLTMQEPGQAHAVGTGPLHTDRHHLPEPGEPAVQVPIARRGRGERLNSQQRTSGIERRGHVLIEVGVHAARHRARALYDGHRHPFHSSTG